MADNRQSEETQSNPSALQRGVNALWKLFPAARPEDKDDPTSEVTNGVLLTDDAGVTENATLTLLGKDSATDQAKVIRQLPNSRNLVYGVYEVMSSDPTIDSAIKMHLGHALSTKVGTNEIVSIESRDDLDDPIVEDLRRTFKNLFNDNLTRWAYNAFLYGTNYLRPYGVPGEGVKLLRCDYYTHPMHVRSYERAGQLVGYTNRYQQDYTANGQVVLMEPWKFVPISMPYYGTYMHQEPLRADHTHFDINADDYSLESLVETQHYGQSGIHTAFASWVDLQEAILSLNMSRRNASKMDRVLGVNTGMLEPQRAARYFNMLASQLSKHNEADAKQLLSKGFVPTVRNLLLPIMGNAKGNLDVNTVEGKPDIRDLADIDFHIKRLGSALGMDPSLLGFGEMLSGGLGEGGFFRVSLMAAMKANAIRTGAHRALERICEQHIAWKYKKVYLPDEKPWRLVFNSLNSAVEQEELQARDMRVQYATSVVSLMQLMDQGLSVSKAPKFANHIMTDLLNIDEEKAKAYIDEMKQQAQEGGDDLMGGFMEAAGGLNRDEMAQIFMETIRDTMGGKPDEQ